MKRICDEIKTVKYVQFSDDYLEIYIRYQSSSTTLRYDDIEDYENDCKLCIELFHLKLKYSAYGFSIYE